MHTAILLFTSAFALAPLASAAPSSDIWDLPSAKATVYYDLTNQLCGDDNPFVNNWAVDSGINGGIPSCESWAGVNAKSLQQLGTNRIVAMDVTKVSGDLANWCGKEVVIFDAQGKQFQFSEGPLYIWDSCAAAAAEPIVDLSAKAFTELKGGTCGGTNPTGLTIQVLNNNIVPAIQRDGTVPAKTSNANFIGEFPSTSSVLGDNTSSSAAASSTVEWTPSPTSSALPSEVPSDIASPTPSSTEYAPAPSAPSAPDAPAAPPAPSAPASSGSCEYGVWRCNGNAIEVCNYVSTSETAWFVSATCPNSCSFDANGSVDCQ